MDNEAAPLEEVGNSLEEWRDSQDATDVKPSTSSSASDFSDKSGSDEELTLYWIDASEERHSAPGSVFLFGKAMHPKTKTLVNCCVVVENIQRGMSIFRL